MGAGSIICIGSGEEQPMARCECGCHQTATKHYDGIISPDLIEMTDRILTLFGVKGQP